MTEKLGISARELLKGVYDTFKKSGREVKLPSKAMAEIASDSDLHRTRIGYTSYESATLLKIGDKVWAVSFGTACGDYPAEPYNCDIVAIQFSSDEKTDEETALEIHRVLEGAHYFRNSLIYAMANGELALNKCGRFGQKVFDLLAPRAQEFVAKGLEIDPEHFTMDLRPVVRSAIQYKPEFVVFLHDLLTTVLR